MASEPRSSVNVTDLKSALKKSPLQPSELEQSVLEGQLVSTRLLLEIQETEEIMKMRREWSGLFKFALVTILVFEIGLTVMVASGHWAVADEWFLRIIVLGGFAQILGLPYTVARFLFNDKSSLSKGHHRN